MDVLADWPPTQRLDEGLFRANLALAPDMAGEAGEAGEADREAATAFSLGAETGSRRTLAVLNGLAVHRAGRCVS